MPKPIKDVLHIWLTFIVGICAALVVLAMVSWKIALVVFAATLALTAFLMVKTFKKVSRDVLDIF